MEPTNIEEFDKYTIKTFIEEDPEDPRAWDNLCIMKCSHNRYNLGDEQINSDNFDGWEQIHEYLRKEEKAILINPLYLYDHSGITISITPFGCRWDSGQVGFIYTTKEMIKKNFDIKRVTNKYLKQAADILKDEVKIYNNYLTGEVYRYVITENIPVKKIIMTVGNNIGTRQILEEETTTQEKVIESCSGFFGDSINEEIKEVKQRLI